MSTIEELLTTHIRTSFLKSKQDDDKETNSLENRRHDNNDENLVLASLVSMVHVSRSSLVARLLLRGT